METKLSYLIYLRLMLSNRILKSEVNVDSYVFLIEISLLSVIKNYSVYILHLRGIKIMEENINKHKKKNKNINIFYLCLYKNTLKYIYLALSQRIIH